MIATRKHKNGMKRLKIDVKDINDVFAYVNLIKENRKHMKTCKTHREAMKNSLQRSMNIQKNKVQFKGCYKQLPRQKKHDLGRLPKEVKHQLINERNDTSNDKRELPSARWFSGHSAGEWRRMGTRRRKQQMQQDPHKEKNGTHKKLKNAVKKKERKDLTNGRTKNK